MLFTSVIIVERQPIAKTKSKRRASLLQEQTTLYHAAAGILPRSLKVAWLSVVQRTLVLILIKDRQGQRIWKMGLQKLTNSFGQIR